MRQRSPDAVCGVELAEGKIVKRFRSEIHVDLTNPDEKGRLQFDMLQPGDTIEKAGQEAKYRMAVMIAGTRRGVLAGTIYLEKSIVEPEPQTELSELYEDNETDADFDPVDDVPIIEEG